MIYGFARQSGGEVVISSVVGRGSTVSISLPRHVGASDDGPLGIDGLRPPASRHGETVLVVEDEQAVRMFVVEVLEHLGYHVLEAADGQAGVAILRSAARIDLLVTDFGLPGGMNGRHVAEAGRALRPKLKVLFITGYAENAALGHFDTHTGMHVLTKPFTLDVLTNRIKTIIGAL
jgi:CheY-like chemotaxis protein